MPLFGWMIRSLAILALAAPFLFGSAGFATADHRRDGWRGSHSRHHDYHRGGHHHWRGHHHGRRHRHHSGVSGLFFFDFSPPPPRRVIVVPPPVPVYVQPPPQAYCREYTSMVMVNGRPVETFGTACLQPDGSWRIVSVN